MHYGFGMSRYAFGYHYGATIAGGRRGGGTPSPAQALVNSFAGTGLLDALLVFDPARYSTPGTTPGVLVDALGGPITYTAPNTQGTPDAVQDGSGYWYANADGVDDTLVASANQTVAYYCAVFRSPPGQTTWSNLGPPLETTTLTDSSMRLGLLSSVSNPAVSPPVTPTSFFYDPPPRAVSRNTIGLVAPFDLSPITSWMTMGVYTHAYALSQALQMFSIAGQYNTRLHLAALAIRYTDPTSDQQTDIKSRLAPMRDALLASAS